MTEPTTDKEPETGDQPAPRSGPADAATPAPAADGMPEYKGGPLDADRGPGLGCFWAQVILLAVLLVLTPLSVYMDAPSWLSATLLILILVLLFFTGQTMIFLLRLVAADRRTRRAGRARGLRRERLRSRRAADLAAAHAGSLAAKSRSRPRVRRGTHR